MADNTIKTWELERFLLGELESKRIKEIENEISRNPELKRHKENLKKANQDFLTHSPAHVIGPEIMREFHKRYSGEQPSQTRKKRILISFVAAPSILLVLLVILTRITQRSPPHAGIISSSESAAKLRIKGNEKPGDPEPHLIVYRKNENSIELLEEGTAVKPGDVLQIAYAPEEKEFGIIFSIDGNGVVTLHFPEDENAETSLKRKKRALLRNSYELDDAPEFECFFFVTSDSVIDTKEILKQAQTAADSFLKTEEWTLNLNDVFQQSTFLLIKKD